MREPFIYLSNPDEDHYSERWESGEPVLVCEQGTHAVWAAKVPFIPDFMTTDFTRTIAGSDNSRIAILTRRQIRFVSDLLNARTMAEGAVAFELRFCVTPGVFGKQSQIELVFLGKVFHGKAPIAEELCHRLWRKFLGHFPLEDPFNYPLEPVEETQLCTYLDPIACRNTPGQLQEIRKYEEVDPYIDDPFTPIGYFPHPFSPTFDATALGRFIETLARQPQRCVVSVLLQPTTLFMEELAGINVMLATYRQIYANTDEHLWLHHYRKERYEDIERTFWPLINTRHHLFKIKIQVIGEEEAPDEVVDALGSELIDNSRTEEPRWWTRERPRSEEDADIAWYNFRFLEHRPWGPERLDASARRLRYLVSAYEAAGAFRLPIPPEGGYLPGLEVRDEPFVLPRLPGAPPGKTITLGEILHRGQPSGQQFHIPLHELPTHTLLGGVTGSGKTNTGLALLSQLWTVYRLPFLVIYPIDKPDYRILMADTAMRDHLLLFTVGDENTAPFRFNPFAVADGVLVRTHMSLLMRCFSAAFWLWDPLPAIYREAIRSVYLHCGWDVEKGVGGLTGIRTPTMADFYGTLVDVSQRMTRDYGNEVKGNIRQGSEIRIRDLLTNIGPVVNASEPAPIADILTRPTVIELGRIGSIEDTTLVMGFLLMLLAEHLQSNMRRLTRAQRAAYLHVTFVEEAHRLMADARPEHQSYTADPRAKGGEDFSHLLAEVRGLGEGLIIAEQLPTKLVSGAVGNTARKIMHRLEDQASFELFCQLMNLSDRQRIYVRTLKTGEAIVRDHTGHPVHVRVSNYLDHFQDDADRTLVDDSDEAVRRMMEGRIVLPEAQQWWSDPIERFYDIPERAAVFAIPKEAFSLEKVAEIGTAASKQEWDKVKAICLAQIQRFGLPHSSGMARCYLARVASLIIDSGEHAGKRIFDVYPSCRTALENFYCN